MIKVILLMLVFGADGKPTGPPFKLAETDGMDQCLYLRDLLVANKRGPEAAYGCKEIILV